MKPDWTYNDLRKDMTCTDADRNAVAEAMRNLPTASATILAHTHTPTGMHRITIRRVRDAT